MCKLPNNSTTTNNDKNKKKNEDQNMNNNAAATDVVNRQNSEMSDGIPYMPSVDFDGLADRALQLLENSQKGNNHASCCRNGFNDYHQVFIGIAGTPGSGKSFIAEQIANKIQQRNPNGDPTKPECVVIGMDGYHLTREQLKEKAGTWFKVEDMDGNVIEKQLSYEQLLARRGAAFTYDPASFIRDLRYVKQNGRGSFPVYDRDKHDPVPDGVRVERHHKVILVEGLYLLCLHDPEWKPLEGLWDDKWYIDVSLEETKRRLVKRHLKHWNDEKTEQWGGDDEDAAARKAKANDLINATCIRKLSRDRANLVISNEVIPEDDDNNADAEAAQ
jgi:pantothenate kinase